VLSTQYIYYT